MSSTDREVDIGLPFLYPIPAETSGNQREGSSATTSKIELGDMRRNSRNQRPYFSTFALGHYVK
jgi:hypothetical protein